MDVYSCRINVRNFLQFKYDLSDLQVLISTWYPFCGFCQCLLILLLLVRPHNHLFTRALLEVEWKQVRLNIALVWCFAGIELAVLF